MNDPQPPQKIVDWSLSGPVTWRTWAAGDGPQEADRVAAQLGANDTARARVREAVLTLDAERRDDGIMLIGVWVPDAETGEPLADMTVGRATLVTGEAQDVDELAASLAPEPKMRGVKIFHHDSGRIEIDSGEAVVVSRIFRSRRSRMVLSTIEWFVVPPNCVDRLHFTFSTPYRAVAEALSDDTIIIVKSLHVDLADA